MSNLNEQDQHPTHETEKVENKSESRHEQKQTQQGESHQGQHFQGRAEEEHPGEPSEKVSEAPQAEMTGHIPTEEQFGDEETTEAHEIGPGEARPSKTSRRPGARGTAAMDPQTRKEVARKGGLAVSRNRQHMAEIGRKGGQTVSKNREHMAQIGRKGGAASRGHR